MKIKTITKKQQGGNKSNFEIFASKNNRLENNLLIVADLCVEFDCLKLNFY